MFEKCKKCEYEEVCPHAYKQEGVCNGGKIETPHITQIMFHGSKQPPREEAERIAKLIDGTIDKFLERNK